MIDKSSPQWVSFAESVMDAVRADRLGENSIWILGHAPSLEAAKKSFDLMKREYAEFRLLRDMWQAERERNSRWLRVTGLMALCFVAIVAVFYYAWTH